MTFRPHTLENRKTRRRATATWTPPEQKTEPFWSDVPADLIGALRVGQTSQSGDGETVRVLAIDRELCRVQVEPVPEPMPTRRHLLEQRKARALGIMDVNTRRLQRKARHDKG